MAGSRQTEMVELRKLVGQYERVAFRAAAVRSEGGWMLHYAEVTLALTESDAQRIWSYDTAVFLEASVPGATVAALLGGAAEQAIAGIKVKASDTATTTASMQRLRGRQEWGRGATTPWPRTEWTIGKDPGHDFALAGEQILVGEEDTPSFLNFDQALSAFFYSSPHNHNANRSDRWRIILPQPDAWLAQISIRPDAMDVDVDGDDLAGASLELSAPAGHQVQQVTAPGRYTLPLPDGLAPDSLLLLRRSRQWLDQRYFPALQYGRARDASVEWVRPGTELEILLAGGEGQNVELKVEVPSGESRKKMLKSIAAFTAQAGGAPS